ncbi:hypothetical protein J2Z32_000971 [Paenibacillus turicensis]|uniref:Uncharacterized protein n=1 Tax=Paenibacillus turicensis TaxID=160487 RepID=A0ABS4FP54_9BACL|nr:hypothetical protein [Paenibacillus turicensis]
MTGCVSQLSHALYNSFQSRAYYLLNMLEGKLAKQLHKHDFVFIKKA